MTSITLCPVLSSKLKDDIGYSPAPLELYYLDDDTSFPLNLKDVNGDANSYTAEIEDPRCQFDIQKHRIIIERDFCVNHAPLLFGSNGIAASGSIIGIAINWIASKSDHRGIIPVGELHNNGSQESLHVSYSFPEDMVKGSLILQTVLYLKETGACDEGEKHLCHQTGTILGTLDICELYLEGNGSVFPIVTINDAGGPLWTVYYDSSADVLQDSFDSEHVEIRVNSAHPAFDDLKLDADVQNSPLFIEMISSAMLVIVESAKQSLDTDFDAVLSGTTTYERGSIAAALHYFVTKLGWDPSSPAALSSSIHNFFNASFKGEKS